MKHDIAYGVSNTATCTCGWKAGAAHGEDLDFAVDTHLGLKTPEEIAAWEADED